MCQAALHWNGIPVESGVVLKEGEWTDILHIKPQRAVPRKGNVPFERPCR